MRHPSRAASLCFALALLSGWPIGAHAQVLTEADAVARALAASPRLRASRARPVQTAAEERARRALPNPTVTVQQEDAANTRDRFVLVEQELPVTGRRSLLARASVHAVGRAEAYARGDAHAIRRDARLAYTGLLAAEARERILREGLGALEGLTGRLRAREQSGEGSTFDRLRAEREHADFGADLRAATTSITEWRARLAAFIGDAGGGTGLSAGDDPRRVPPAPPLAAIIEVARTRRPALDAANAEIERLRFERLAAARLAWPQPVVSGGWKRTDESARSGDGYAVAVGVAIPLFSRGVAEAAAVSSALAGAEATRDAVVRDIETEVRVAHARAVDGRARAAAYQDEALARSRDLVRIASLAYDDGEVGILELLDAHRTLLGAELRALDLHVEARLATIDLDYASAEEVIR